jgi:hypothetical protein
MSNELQGENLSTDKNLVTRYRVCEPILSAAEMLALTLLPGDAKSRRHRRFS